TMSTNNWNRNNEFNFFGNLFAEVHPLKNLVFNSNFGYMYDNTYQRQILQEYSDGFISRVVNSLNINQGNELDLTWSNTLNYHLSAGHSRADFLLGTEAITRTYNTQGDYKQGFAIQNNNYFYLNAGTGLTTNSGTSTGDQLLSFFGKINYAWSDKYLASVTLRQDGSSRFGANNRYGLFPAASVGWVISKEPFFRNVRFISNLKLRAGGGVTGNQEIGDDASLGLYQTNYGTIGQPGPSNIWNAQAFANNGTAYDISGAGTGSLSSGYVSVQAANPALKWESTLGFNEGIDFGILQNTISGSFDYFSRKTTNILIQPPYAGIEGEGQTQWVNGASMSNKGWELELGYNGQIGQLSYSINGNLFSFRNKITYLPASVISAYPGDVQQTILGHAPSEMFGYVVQGIFQNQAEITKHATQPGAGVGRLMYKDLNNNGQIDVLDQTWLGNQLPNLNYGLMVNLGYKAFSFSFFLQGIQGNRVNNGTKGATDFVGLNPGVNVGSRTLNAWTPENTKSTIPALSLVDNNDEQRFSSYYVESGSYMKLRNMELGYNVPSKSLQHLGVDRLKVYLMGENLLTIKKTHGSDAFTGPDPENPSSLYPIPRRLTVGVNISF
ncbi:MAG TPA: SusC/RagA family TonB-linked outer membrane protein, partial [Hanamia sp.]|nr:SusC/RagA family TonB-linked outer membrane protein [Hanamia sp.]